MREPSDIEIINTTDGSHTLVLKNLNETYHSTHGARTESEYVFIEKGLGHVDKDKVTILEIGLGTGLNALLTSLASEGSSQQVCYHTIESNPLSPKILEKLNYPETEMQKKLFDQIHSVEWDRTVKLHNTFEILKINGSWLDHRSPPDLYDIIYYDAFAPSRQPEMWSLPLLEKSYNILKTCGILVTYCAQGQFKRDLRTAGFQVEELPGPPGKAEMVRATKQ